LYSIRRANAKAKPKITLFQQTIPAKANHQALEPPNKPKKAQTVLKQDSQPKPKQPAYSISKIAKPKTTASRFLIIHQI